MTLFTSSFSTLIRVWAKLTRFEELLIRPSHQLNDNQLGYILNNGTFLPSSAAPISTMMNYSKEAVYELCLTMIITTSPTLFYS